MRDDMTELFERLVLTKSKCRDLETTITNLAGACISHWLVRGARPGSGQIFAKLLNHPPVSIRQDVGMIVNEQRAILDGLACTLATRNRANNITDVAFPIAKSELDFRNPTCKKKIRKLSPADQLAIADLKPWCPPTEDSEKGSLVLFRLHEADRVRKHQKLLRWACLGGVNPIGDGMVERFETGATVFTVVGKEETLASFSGVTCQLGVEFQMIYLEPDALKGHLVAPLLSAFNQTVESILRRFA